MSLIRPDYLPSGRGARAGWLNDFSINVPQFQTPLELTSNTIATVTYYAAVCNYLVYTAEPTAHIYWNNLSALVDEVDTDSTPNTFVYPSYPTISAPPTPPVGASPLSTGIFNYMVELVGDIKRHKNYTKQIGTTLKIEVPATPPPPPDDAKPRGKTPVTLPGGAVTFTLVMGHYRLIVGHMRRNGASEWEKSYTIVTSKWTDTTPNANPGRADSREYQFRYSDGINEIGQWSDIFAVSTQA